jgi:hypothetical protein
VSNSEATPRFLTRSEAAVHLNVSERWLATGGYLLVPHLKFGRMVRYDITDLNAWAEQQRVRR